MRVAIGLWALASVVGATFARADEGAAAQEGAAAPPADPGAATGGTSAQATVPAAAALELAPVEPAGPVVEAAPTTPAPSPTHFAIGVSLGFLRQQDLGRQIATRFVPELVGFGYIKLAPRWYLRPGLRLGTTALSPIEAPTDGYVKETGWQSRAELGVLYDAWLIPSLSVGVGAERRHIRFVGTGVAQASSTLDRDEWLGAFYAQAGVGLPLFRGALVVEPYARYQRTPADDRASSQLGFDVTFAL